jgi:hypothetical protein
VTPTPATRDDRLTGGDDRIAGGDGVDDVRGDGLQAMAGDDEIEAGKDVLAGGPGADILRGKTSAEGPAMTGS